LLLALTIIGVALSASAAAAAVTRNCGTSYGYADEGLTITNGSCALARRVVRGPARITPGTHYRDFTSYGFKCRVLQFGSETSSRPSISRCHRGETVVVWKFHP
jgi:hypothetical protein